MVTRRLPSAVQCWSRWWSGTPANRCRASSGGTRLAWPRGVRHRPLATLGEKLIRIGAKVVRHACYRVSQMAEVTIPKRLFASILERIPGLRPLVPAPGGLTRPS